MFSIPNDSKGRVLLGIGAALLAAGALAGVLALESGAFGPSVPAASWLFYVAAVACYLVLQFFAESVHEGFWGSSSLVAKAVAILLIVGLYASWVVYVA